jgi:hypothetical protein
LLGDNIPPSIIAVLDEDTLGVLKLKRNARRVFRRPHIVTNELAANHIRRLTDIDMRVPPTFRCHLPRMRCIDTGTPEDQPRLEIEPKPRSVKLEERDVRFILDAIVRKELLADKCGSFWPPGGRYRD